MSDTAIALSSNDLRRILSQRCDELGSQTEFSKRYGIARTQISETLSGKREVSSSIVTALGYLPVTRYVPRAGR